MKARKRRSNPDGSLSRVMLREQIAFATATRDAMVKMGAKEVYPAYENKEGSLVVSMGVYEIDTKAGPLRVSCSGDAIFTQFVYPQCEGHGKWNFHKFHVGIDFQQDDPERKLLALFLERLRPMLPEQQA